ncbi:penicillin-insensitive murein endopeptidase [Yersinia pseudotuberculosis]|nr:penicillin-insensitive murein endopeptidase [Yersinia pseudotuberculosis]SUP87360.1 penicillin-insensitive murein endopeptidase [Yersinia pseudotuberculosis]
MVALVTMVPVMAATPWQKITHPVAGSPQSIGGFANGCVIGRSLCRSSLQTIK